MTPVIFTAFANQQDNYLQTLNQEQESIQNALLNLDTQGKIKHSNWNEIKLDAFFNVLREHSGNVRIIHFAGHASSKVLAMNEKDAIMEGIIDRLKNETNVELVFLNGCSTHAHVKGLLDAGVKAVIATSCSIDDTIASEFAAQFYMNLAKNQDIVMSYKNASAFVKAISADSRFRSFGSVKYRAEISENESNNGAFEWGLYLCDEKYKPWSIEMKKTYNLKNINTLIFEMFDDTSLTVFCMNNYQKVYKNFTNGQNLQIKIIALIDYCKNRMELEKLLELLEKENKSQFEQYKPYY